MKPSCARLAGRVVRPARIAGDGAGDRRGQDHAAASPASARADRPAGVERAARGVQHQVPGRPVDLFQRRAGEDAGVGADDVDAAMVPRHGARRRPSRCGRRRPRIATRLAAAATSASAQAWAASRERASRPRGRPVRPGLRRCPADARLAPVTTATFPGWKQTWRAPGWMEPILRRRRRALDLPGQLLDRARRLGLP